MNEIANLIFGAIIDRTKVYIREVRSSLPKYKHCCWQVTFYAALDMLLVFSLFVVTAIPALIILSRILCPTAP